MTRRSMSDVWVRPENSLTLANRLVEPLAVFLGLFLLFTAMTAIFFWHWVAYLNLALPGPPEDNMQDFWNTWYVAVARHPGGFFFTNLIRFPEGTPLYYHSFAYPKVFAIALLSKVVGTDTTSLILLQNISILISFPLAATGAFYLVRYLTANTAGALLGSFVFAFNPSHVEHAMHHAGVSSIELIPFFVLSYLMTIERQSLLSLSLTIVFYALNALSCWYYLFYLAYFIAFHTAYIAIRDRALPSGWQLFTPIACLAGVIAVLSPILVPMVRMTMGGPSLYVEGSNEFVADVVAYCAFPWFHLLGPLAQGIYARLSGNVWEVTVYLGVVNIAVLAWLCLAARRKEALVYYVLCGIAVFGVVASGDWLHVLGHSTIPMPDAVLSRLPFIADMTSPSRAIVFVYLFLAIGVGYAITVAGQYRQRPLARWGMVVVAVAIVLDFLPVRRLAMTPVACSPGLSVIRDDPEKDSGVLDLPFGYIEGNFYMLQQAACHGHPIVQGNTSRNLVVSLRDRLETKNLQAQRRQLAGAGVKYIVVHRMIPGHREDWPQDQYPLSYPAVYDSPDLSILLVY